MNKIINEVTGVNHPKNVGVEIKHYFSSQDNDRLNNLLVKIDPGCQISPHIHDNSSEFYYVVEGKGEFFIDGKWHEVQSGSALKAPTGEEHGLKNTGDTPFVLFSTFSPPVK